MPPKGRSQRAQTTSQSIKSPLSVRDWIKSVVDGARRTLSFMKAVKESVGRSKRAPASKPARLTSSPRAAATTEAPATRPTKQRETIRPVAGATVEFTGPTVAVAGSAMELAGEEPPMPVRGARRRETRADEMGADGRASADGRANADGLAVADGLADELTVGSLFVGLLPAQRSSQDRVASHRAPVDSGPMSLSLAGPVHFRPLGGSAPEGPVLG